MYKKVVKFSFKRQKIFWVLVFSFMYLVLVDAMDKSVISIQPIELFYWLSANSFYLHTHAILDPKFKTLTLAKQCSSCEKVALFYGTIHNTALPSLLSSHTSLQCRTVGRPENVKGTVEKLLLVHIAPLLLNPVPTPLQ